MSELTFQLKFHDSVRMGTGIAGHGLDEVLDRFAPLKAAGFKGVIRDEARVLLPPHTNKDGLFVKDHEFIRSVFGDGGGLTCPWNFEAVTEAAIAGTRANLRLAEDGSVVPGALLVKEEAWVTKAMLHVHQRGPLRSAGLPETVLSEDSQDPVRKAHLALLRVAASLCEKVGQRKTRGMGWIAIDAKASEADLDLVLRIREG